MTETCATEICLYCPTDNGYVSKKADVSPGTNPGRKPSEACEKSCDDQEGFVTLSEPGKVSGPIERLHEELQALKERVDNLETGGFGLEDRVRSLEEDFLENLPEGFGR